MDLNVQRLIKKGYNMSKVLIVVDMQNDFITGALASPQGPEILNGVIDYVKNFDGEVIYTMDTHYDNYLETLEGKNLPVLHCIKGTHGWQIPTDLLSALESKKAKSIEKLSFGSPDLIKYLVQKTENNEVDEIFLIGICTDICVVTNAIALKCSIHNTPITVISSLCAGVTLESHDNALQTMKCCQINIE